MPDVAKYAPNYTQDKTKRHVPLPRSASPVDAAVAFVKQALPGISYRVANDHFTSTSGVTHVNLKQTLHGLDIDNADFKVNVDGDGSVFSFSNNFFSGELLAENPLTLKGLTKPIVALQGAAKLLGLQIDVGKSSVEADTSRENTYIVKSVSGVARDPVLKLVYTVAPDGKLQLAWRVETDVTHNWIRSYIDAKTNDKIYGAYDHVFQFSASMKVFPWGVADPSEGSRTIVHNPWDDEASPFTWFGDGNDNYTTTIGNNAMAQTDPNGSGSTSTTFRPNSSTYNFDYPYSAKLEPDQMAAASVTQLFYTGNKYHDLLWHLGFNEKAGNFQQNNLGRGGRGGDRAWLNCQDGFAENGAGFVTFPDGQLGQMRLGVWDSATPKRDSAFDASVVIHEYTHGGTSTKRQLGSKNANVTSFNATYRRP